MGILLSESMRDLFQIKSGLLSVCVCLLFQLLCVCPMGRGNSFSLSNLKDEYE